MRHEFKVGDVISEIGVPRLYVVVEVKKKAYYYSLQEIDKHGRTCTASMGRTRAVYMRGSSRLGDGEARRSHLG